MASYTNYQVKRNKQKNAVGLYDKTANYNKSHKKMTKSDRLMNGIAEWTAFYRSRPDIFVEDYLGITLKPFQKVMLYVMMHYNYTMFLASRGLGKTFLTALYCVVRCILYPGSKIIVASKTKEQAMTLVSEKIPELIQLSTTGMLEREISGSIKTSMNTADPNVLFLNGSWIKVVPANQNARSKRANVLVLDEFRMIDPDIYRNVLRRFLATSRQTGYMRKPEYKNDSRYKERNQEIFLSSAYYKFNWSYQRYNVFLNSMLEGRKYFVCGLPYQFAIKEGLANAEQLMDELREDDIDEVGWEMEMNCKFFGESEKAYFKTEEINMTRNLYSPVYPKHMYDLVRDKSFKYPKKKDDEVRLLSVDIAMIADNANDASIYTLIQLFPIRRKINGVEKVLGYERHYSYMESHMGGHTELQAIRIRQLYEDLDCDYIVLDRYGNGIGVYDSLCRNLYDKERDVVYKAFMSMNEDKMKERCLEPDAEEKIFTIAATAELNSEIGTKFKDDMKKKKIKMLATKEEVNDFFYNIAGFHKLEIEQQAAFYMPYKQFDMLANEMVLLEGERTDKGLLKLKEQKGNRKDRYTSCSYGNYFASILEAELIKANQDYDDDDPLVFF